MRTRQILIRLVQSCGLAALLLFAAPAPGNAQTARATFAGGCFWCMEPPFDELEGVISTTSGYIAGKTKNPTYEQVSTGTTGHTEALQVVYDPKKITYEKLLEVFWRNIDPLAANGQFCDLGSQYRSGIFYHDGNQKSAAEKSKKAIQSPLQAAGGDRNHRRDGFLPRRGLSSGLLQEKSAALQTLFPWLRPGAAAGRSLGRGEEVGALKLACAAFYASAR